MESGFDAIPRDLLCLKRGKRLKMIIHRISLLTSEYINIPCPAMKKTKLLFPDRVLTQGPLLLLRLRLEDDGGAGPRADRHDLVHGGVEIPLQRAVRRG